MNHIIFSITLIAATTLSALTGLSYLRPSFIFFPPPSKTSWQYRLFWWLFRVMVLGIAILSVTTFNPQPLINGFVRYGVCLPLFIAGFAMATYLSARLGWQNAHGEVQGLVVSGWYRYSRNPVYVFSLLGMLGLGMFVHSPQLYCLLSLWAILYLIAPVIEERWLERTYGAAYLAYKAKTARFFGRPAK